MGDKYLTNPSSTMSFGKKKMSDGKFENPPAFPQTSGFYSAGVIQPRDSVIQGLLQKTPSARKGKV